MMRNPGRWTYFLFGSCDHRHGNESSQGNRCVRLFVGSPGNLEIRKNVAGIDGRHFGRRTLRVRAVAILGAERGANGLIGRCLSLVVGFQERRRVLLDGGE